MHVAMKLLLTFSGGIFLGAASSPAPSDTILSSEYFEGRWAFEEETCDQPTNWTLLAGGNFVSEDLTGTWVWQDEKLLLKLTDLAVDEETGEAGGRFQMDGPIKDAESDSFTFVVDPDSYKMKRCP